STIMPRRGRGKRRERDCRGRRFQRPQTACLHSSQYLYPIQFLTARTDSPQSECLLSLALYMADISILVTRGHFYFGSTPSSRGTEIAATRQRSWRLDGSAGMRVQR